MEFKTTLNGLNTSKRFIKLPLIRQKETLWQWSVDIVITKKKSQNQFDNHCIPVRDYSEKKIVTEGWFTSSKQRTCKEMWHIDNANYPDGYFTVQK